MPNTAIDFFSDVILRSPNLPFSSTKLSKTTITKLATNNLFMRALFFASPVVHHEMVKWANGELKEQQKIDKLIFTIGKYYNRMQSRCTPFGLFSAMSLIKWSSQTNIVKDVNSLQTELKLDNHFLNNLAEHLVQNPSIKNLLRYSVNTTLFLLDNEYRYYAKTDNQKTTFYELNAVETTDIMQKALDICTAADVPFAKIASSLGNNTDYTSEEIEAYLNMLIDEQILVSSLTPKLSGDYLTQIINELQLIQNVAPNEEIVFIISALNGLFSTLSAYTNANHEHTINEALKIIDGFKIGYDAQKLFQVNSYDSIATNCVNNNIQQHLRDGIHALQILTTAESSNTLLDEAKANLKEILDEHEMPINKLADPDLNILKNKSHGLHNYGAAILNELNEEEQKKDSAANKSTYISNEFLTEKIIEASFNGDFCISISDNDLEKLKGSNKLKPLPDTFPVIFQIADPDQPLVYIENISGSSGTTLLARFAHFDKSYQNLYNEITRYEDSLHAGAVNVHLAHIPENRTGNILSQLRSRTHQAAYFAGVEKCDHNIDVNDIILYLENDIVRLKSAKLGKLIIPKIDNAHNYVSYGLPLYKLWGALQGQEHQTNLNLNIDIPGIKFTPRIEYKRAIIKAAQWRFNSPDFKDLLAGPFISNSFKKWQSFFKKWRLPVWFMLADGDQTLVFNHNDIFSIELFASVIKNKKSVILKEFFGSSKQLVNNLQGHSYQHQLIAIAKNNHFKPLATYVANKTGFTDEIGFLPGSTWIYYKIYCSQSFSNLLLVNYLQPLCQNLLEESIIKKWFFIRYTDQHEHLRFRVQVNDIKNLHLITEAFNHTVATLHKQKLVWKIQIEDYKREFKRYNSCDYNALESFFFADSQLCIDLRASADQYPPNLNLIWFSLKIADCITTLFNFTPLQKKQFAESRAESFQVEMSTAETEKKIISSYFKENSNEIKGITQSDFLSQYPAIDTLISKWYAQQAENISMMLNKDSGQASPIKLAADLIHMHFNRLFFAKQRQHEMIGYTLLKKLYAYQLHAVKQ
jgi:thiopeptide-type bacteriocin biosynthesis protein